MGNKAVDYLCEKGILTEAGEEEKKEDTSSAVGDFHLITKGTIIGAWHVGTRHDGSGWYIVNKDTGKSKYIGPVTGKGTNYFDRAVDEAKRRNKAEAEKRGEKYEEPEYKKPEYEFDVSDKGKRIGMVRIIRHADDIEIALHDTSFDHNKYARVIVPNESIPAFLDFAKTQLNKIEE